MSEMDCQSVNVALAARVVEEKKNFIYTVVRANKCEEEAEDILQHLFLSLALKPIPNGIDGVESYLYRAIINDIIDIRRKKAVHQNVINRFLKHIQVENNSITGELIIKEEVERIFYLVETRLPPYLYTPFHLRYKQEYTISEIAEKLRVSKNVVRVYLSTALKRIRKILEMESGDDKYNEF